LGLNGKENIDKAKELNAMGLHEILGLKFEGDQFRSGALQNWIDGSVRKELQSYITSPTVQKEIADKNFRAFAVVIVGLRQILVREMDMYGNWIGEFQLAK
jgi:hypothetical protein